MIPSWFWTTLRMCGEASSAGPGMWQTGFTCATPLGPQPPEELLHKQQQGTPEMLLT